MSTKEFVSTLRKLANRQRTGGLDGHAVHSELAAQTIERQAAAIRMLREALETVTQYGTIMARFNVDDHDAIIDAIAQAKEFEE